MASILAEKKKGKTGKHKSDRHVTFYIPEEKKQGPIARQIITPPDILNAMLQQPSGKPLVTPRYWERKVNGRKSEKVAPRKVEERHAKVRYSKIEEDCDELDLSPVLAAPRSQSSLHKFLQNSEPINTKPPAPWYSKIPVVSNWCRKMVAEFGRNT